MSRVYAETYRSTAVAVLQSADVIHEPFSQNSDSRPNPDVSSLESTCDAAATARRVLQGRMPVVLFEGVLWISAKE